MSDKARRALTDYYAYMNREANGYASETITGKMVKGNIGGGNPGSTIPKGVKMTDLDFLKFIDKMDLIVDYMAEHHNSSFEYVRLFYDECLMQKEIIGRPGYDNKTQCQKLHNIALSIIDVKL